jgi:hypothetical protein
MKAIPIWTNTLRALAGRGVLLACLTATGSLLLSNHGVWAQQRGPEQRVVQGKVTDKSEAPIKGAVVYLKDGHTLSVKSYLTNDQGEYRFGQLAQNTDYEIWAESNGKKSNVRNISSFESKNQFLFNFKVDTGK